MKLIDRKFKVVYYYRNTRDTTGTLWKCPACQSTVVRITDLDNISNIGIDTEKLAIPHHLKKHGGGYGVMLNKEIATGVASRR